MLGIYFIFIYDDNNFEFGLSFFISMVPESTLCDMLFVILVSVRL